MSSKRKQSTLSQSSSSSGSEAENVEKKSRLGTLSGGSSSESEKEGSRKSRSKSRSKSKSGSDSGTARSKSSSRAGSAASRSRSKSSGKSGSDSGTGGSRPSSPVGSGGKKSSGSSSSSSPGPSNTQNQPEKGGAIYSSSSGSSQSSNKSKKLKKSKEHKPSSKLQKTLSASDSEDEEDAKKKKARIPRKTKKPEKKDESSDDQADWRVEFDDGLDDEFIGDEKDRDMLEDMTEREREEELYKRAEKREELKKRFEISQKLKKQNKNKNLEKRESGSDEGELREDREDRDDAAYLAESGSRKKGYEEKYGSKFNALSELKAKREEKERKEKMREEKQKKKSRKKESESESGSDYEKLGRRKKKKVLKASEIYSSSSSDDGDNVRRKTSSEHSSSSVSSISESGGESDTERQNSKKTVKKAMNIDTVEELEKIRLSRFKLDKFCHLPCFKKTVVGCFVRIGIGKNTETNKDVYRCCEIMDICETGKVYNVMKTKTNIGLKLRFGKDTRIFRLQFVSNQALTESEFTNWKKACHEGNILLPTVAHREQKEKDIKYALEYRFSSYDVEKILASKGKFNQSPKNFAMYKAKLMKERDMAETAGDTEKVAKLTQDLDVLEEKAEDLDKKRTSTISTISLINDRNRKNNVARAYTGIQADEERRRREGDVDDPFTRRKTKPKLGFAGKNKEPEMTSELLQKLELEKAKSEKKEKTPLSILPPPVDISKLAGSKDISGTRPKLDIFDAHNFELDINVDGIQATPVTPSINLKPVTAIETPAGPLKRSLKLDEWKKKRGII